MLKHTKYHLQSSLKPLQI